MRSKVYLETTIASYLTAWLSRDLIKAAHQQITQDWWKTRDRFELFVSQVVLDEAGKGDPQAAELRLASLANIPVLSASPEASALARQLVTEGPLPPKAVIDALHIGIAVVHGMDYLLTWNCAHIANAAIRRKIDAICRESGYVPIVLCTPEELMEE